MIKVKKSNRFGYTKGCWKITQRQANALCLRFKVRIPRMGYMTPLKEEPGTSWNEQRTVSFPTTFRAWLTNNSNAEFLLTDENNILDVEETDDE